jgi:serine/threonine protein kinase
MSPEQVRRTRDVDHRSDLWSLGVIVYRCLTGFLPFPGEELGEVLVAICTDDIALATELAPDLDPCWNAFLMRALMRDRDDRFQSANEFEETYATIVCMGGPDEQFPTIHRPAETSSATESLAARTLAATESHIALPSGLLPTRGRRLWIPLVSLARVVFIGFVVIAQIAVAPSAPTPAAAVLVPTLSASRKALEESPPPAISALAVPSASVSASIAPIAPIAPRLPAKRTPVLPMAKTPNKPQGKADDPLKQMR